MMATDLNKQEELDADPKAIQQINFTENLDQVGQKSVYFITEKAKKPFWIFHKKLRKYFEFILL